jgi:hypothetical protein
MEMKNEGTPTPRTCRTCPRCCVCQRYLFQTRNERICTILLDSPPVGTIRVSIFSLPLSGDRLDQMVTYQKVEVDAFLHNPAGRHAMASRELSKHFAAYFYQLIVECHYIVDAFLCQDIVDTQLG